MDGWAGLLRSAGELGVVHARGGLGFGISEDALRRRARREAWESPLPSVFVLPWQRSDDPRVRLAAGLVSAGAPAFAAGETALWLADVIPVSDPPRQTTVLLPHERRWRPPRPIQVIRSRRLPTSHLTRTAGFPSTTVARALCDLAERGASLARLRGLALRARRLGVSDLVQDLRACTEAFGSGRRGLDAVDALVTQIAHDGADSNAEFRWRRILRAAGLPVWHEPFPYRCADGVVVHLDVAIPSAWVALEHDGAGPHSTPGTFRTDRVRWSQIGREWSLVWATEEDLTAPERVVAEVRARVDAAAPHRRPAQPAT